MPDHQDIKQNSGFLNTDDPNQNIPSTNHKMAKNGRFRGNGNNMQFEGVPGTTAISNTLPAGTNECIGRFYDDLKQRIFYFNYNSNNNHAIYVYSISDNSVTTVAMIGGGTDGDIFKFTLDGPIYSVKMLYGDAIQGDILYFNNSQKEPCQINIDRAIAGGYGVIKRSYIDVIKAPSLMPPAVTYENDSTVTVNNLRKKLFRTRTRPVYGDNTKGVWSAESVMPLPINYMDTAIDKDPTKNCRIAIVIPTGEADVQKIEIAAIIQPDSAINGSTEAVGYFVIKVVDKAIESVPSNDLYTFRFYNDQAYLPIDPIESVQLQDLVPLQANSLEFLNGNVPIYGGILEGFNQTIILGSTTSASEPEQTTQPSFLFVANQSGDSGFGTGNIHIVVIGAIPTNKTFDIFTTHEVISYLSVGGDDASDVIAGLSASALSLGFTIVSSDAENLFVIKTGESLLRTLASGALIPVSDSFVYDRDSRYDFAIEYLDGSGRTIGSQTNRTVPFQTMRYTETSGVPNIPKISLSISNRPPLYARYFHITRTKNLSKLTKLEWVSQQTFKDKDFAYISIENLNTFIKENPAAKHLAYDFSSNDRIRFIKLLSGTPTVYVNQDFEIQSQVFSPTINGIVEEGQFVKISLPTTSGTFDFGTSDFNNYHIELYTPAQSVAEGLDKYYEFGERYTIGNPGTDQAFHQGLLQNQTPDLVSPALFEFTQGDYYYRPRTINTGGELDYIITTGERGAGRHTMGVDFVDRNFTDPNITTGNSPLQNLSGWTFADISRAIVKMGASAPTTTFRAQGTIKVEFLNPDTFSFFFQDNTGLITYAVTPRLMPNTPEVYTFDCTFTLAANQFISFLGYSDTDFTDSKQYSQTDFKITIQNPFTIGIIDPNFSDFFASAVNSNGRPSIVDVNAAQVFNPTLLRWGLAYLPDTNINQTNRFREINFDEVDRSKGQIQVLNTREMILQIIQERGVCQKAIYGKILQDSDGNNILSTTDDILSKNNANYYEGKHGIGNQPMAWSNSRVAFYFIDDITGEQIRLDTEGMNSISVQNKGQYYLKTLLTPYNNVYVRTNGSKSKIIGFYDFFEDQAMTILQQGTFMGNVIADYLFSFNEKRNAYCSFYDYANAEMAIGAQDMIFSWKNGAMYKHDNQTTWCNFYGTQFYPSITLVFNDKIELKKTFQALAFQANQIWVADTNGDINTSQPNPQTKLPQISQLKARDFDENEYLKYAAFLQDANSMIDPVEALVNGDMLKGVWIEIKLTYKGSDYAYLYLPYVSYILSPKNL